MWIKIIFLALVFSLSEMVLSATLDCQRHPELDDIIHCELSVKSDEQLAISGYDSYGNQHYDDAEAIAIGYKNVVKYFPVGVGKVFGKLKALDLSVSSLSFVSRPCFENMNALKDLKLFHNEIEVIPSDAFTDIPNLEYLNLVNNKISKFDENLLANQPNLKHFDARNNNLEEFSANLFKNNKEIKKINLKGNKIKKIDLMLFESQQWDLSVFDLRGNGENCDLRFDSREGSESFVDFIQRAKKLCNIE